MVTSYRDRKAIWLCYKKHLTKERKKNKEQELANFGNNLLKENYHSDDLAERGLPTWNLENAHLE